MKLRHALPIVDDKIDAEKIARLLRGGNLPIAYAYPKGLRATRDRLRRRMYLVHKRAEVSAHLVNTNSQYNLPPFGKMFGLVYCLVLCARSHFIFGRSPVHGRRRPTRMTY